ncbi:MAG: valine--tRNA ligase [Candidatus Undinarchaeales archaeon]|nr:valine--tRNA ligase [Candidatus Undinarchaeales archaeon]
MQEFTPVLTDKRWKIQLEPEIGATWEKKGHYTFDHTKDAQVWSIDTPPPYASGKWHLGGAIHYTLIDIIARIKRMKGFNVNFPMGIDRNGLPIEVQAEKEFNVSMRDVPRNDFLRMCKELLDKYEVQIVAMCRALGFSVNSLEHDGVYRTDDPGYRALTQETFIEMWKKGLIYESGRPNNYCTDCNTTIADAEIEYATAPTQFVHLRFTVKETGDELVIATTRPELLCSCSCVLVHPKDERYAHLPGKHAIVPHYGIEVPIMTHREADPEKGTGVVMICSYGDSTDVRLYRELGMKPVIAIDTYGKMLDVAGEIAGLPVTEAREKIVQILDDDDAIITKVRIKHPTPICWRSKTPIEFIPMPEYYLKQVDHIDTIRDFSKDIEFHPPNSRQLLLDWLDAVTVDWPISRRRYYGTEVPVWYCTKCNEPHVPEPGPYYQPWKDKPPFDTCTKCGNGGFRGDERVFDTWMDSSISPFFITGYNRNEELFKKAFPCSVRPQGKDIVRTWLYYTLLRGYHLTGKSVFDHVWISGHVVDEDGRKMSKSLGNITYPDPLIKQYGADALRLFGCLEASLGSDIRFSEERLKGASKYVQKLFNISRFVSMFPLVEDPADVELQGMDRWALASLNKMVADAEKGYDALDFLFPAVSVRSFTWSVFADIYLEAVKRRAYNSDGEFSEAQQKAAWFTLHYCMKTILKVTAPIMPFVTDHVWTTVYAKTTIHHEAYPEPTELAEDAFTDLTGTITQLLSFVWKEKKSEDRKKERPDVKLNLRSEVAELWIPPSLEPFILDIKAMHNAKECSIGAPASEEGYLVAEVAPDEKAYLKVWAD